MQADLKMNFFVEDLINLPKVRVRSVVREREAIFLQLGFREEEVACPHCGKKTGELNQTRTVRVRDLPISGQLVYLQIVLHSNDAVRSEFLPRRDLRIQIALLLITTHKLRRSTRLQSQA